MPTIKLYGGRAGSSFRPHWMLAEAGLAYEAMPLDMKLKEHKSEAYLAINPAGQVPAMIYDGFTLTESAAIVHFLAEKHAPQLLGATPEERATALRWELYVMLNINPALTSHALKAWGYEITDAALEEAAADLDESLPILEGWLKGKEFILGTAFSTADIVACSTFNYAEAAKLDLAAYPASQAWIEKCTARVAYKQAKEGVHASA